MNWFESLEIDIETLLLFMGDFNFIRSLENRNLPGGNLEDIFKFNEIISSLAMLEIPIKGRQYTWGNMQDQPLLEQLDWFFSSAEWILVFSITFGQTIETYIPKSKLFRFESFWPLHPVFLEVVQNSWNAPIRASSAITISAKLKHLRYPLKKWSKSFSKISLLLENSNRALLQLDGLDDLRPLAIPEFNFRVILKAHIIRLLGYQNAYRRKRPYRYVKGD